MILYNVTINIEESAASEWLEWMKNVHIPEVMNTGLFLDYKIFRILSRQEDESGDTFSIQYFLKDIAHYKQYEFGFAPALQKEHVDKYGGKFMAFRTILEQI